MTDVTVLLVFAAAVAVLFGLIWLCDLARG
jgi:hypothetical protein